MATLLHTSATLRTFSERVKEQVCEVEVEILAYDPHTGADPVSEICERKLCKGGCGVCKIHCRCGETK